MRLLSLPAEDTTTVITADNLCNSVLHTLYLGTENSSDITKSRARRLSESINSYFMCLTFDIIVRAVLEVFATFTNKVPKFQFHGGTEREDIALQNIQARLRMVLAYLCAQLTPWVRNRSGYLLVLGSSNVDEALRGYLTKYDCSSADINPIGGISKGDLKGMLAWASEKYTLPVLLEIAEAVPTVEYYSTH